MSLGLAVKEIKDFVVVGEGGGKEEEKKGDVGKGFKVEIPEAGIGKRYADGWIVGKVVKL